MPQQEKTGYYRTSHSEPAVGSDDDDVRFALSALIDLSKGLSVSYDQRKVLQQELADEQKHLCEKDREIMKLADENERLKGQVINQAAQIRELVADNIHLKAMNDELVQENAALKQQLNMS